MALATLLVEAYQPDTGIVSLKGLSAGLDMNTDAAVSVVADGGATGGQALVFPAGANVILQYTAINALISAWGQTQDFAVSYNWRWNEALTTSVGPLRLVMGEIATDGFDAGPEAALSAGTVGVSWQLPLDGGYVPNMPASGAYALNAWHTTFFMWDHTLQQLQTQTDGGAVSVVNAGIPAGAADTTSIFSVYCNGTQTTGDFRLGAVNLWRTIPSSADRALVFGGLDYARWAGGGVGATIIPASGSVSIVGKQATVSQPNVLHPSSGALALAGVAGTVSLQVYRTPSAGAVTVAGTSAGVVASVSRQPGTGALSASGIAATVAATANHFITPDSAGASIVGVAPFAQVSIAGFINPLSGSLSLTGQSPGVTNGPPVTIQTAAGSLTLAGVAPVASVSVNTSRQPGTGTLTGAGVAVTLTVAAAATRQPGAAALALAGVAPTVAVHISTVLTPSTGALVMNGAVPTPTPLSNALLVTCTVDANGHVVAVWGGDATTQSYDLYRTDVQAGQSALLVSLPAGVTTYTDTDPLNGDSYYEVVAAGSVRSVFPTAHCVRNNDGTITLTWLGDPFSLGYKVSRKNALDLAPVLLRVVSPGILAYIDSAAPSGNPFYQIVSMR